MRVRTCSSNVISIFCRPRNEVGIPWPATQRSHWPQILTMKSEFARLLRSGNSFGMKRKGRPPPNKAKGGVPRQFTERRVFFDRPAATPPVAGKFHSSHKVCATCFRCFRQGHFARDCRSAVASGRPDGSGPANSQQSAQ